MLEILAQRQAAAARAANNSALPGFRGTLGNLNFVQSSCAPKALAVSTTMALITKCDPCRRAGIPATQVQSLSLFLLFYSIITSFLSSYTPTPLTCLLLLSPGAITIIVPSLLLQPLLFYNLFSFITSSLLLQPLLFYNLFSFITSSLLLYTYPTDLPSLVVTRCDHYHCPFSSLITSSLL